eukprot:gnl/MRDRNA2_/MRDRNA2_118600_c0_seq1.p1 gnl/MRDRNA2_/MRDRNA2_118600_c0~~gnl/MRDRNA2_/MRDRNA2_118600_c0_seq1.p1  ORF type:complete len:780 (+),score=138.07 gnl/MRDRNA2_/MRDRNA2_118600_c0_seq1:78-2417(+)
MALAAHGSHAAAAAHHVDARMHTDITNHKAMNHKAVESISAPDDSAMNHTAVESTSAPDDSSFSASDGKVDAEEAPMHTVMIQKSGEARNADVHVLVRHATTCATSTVAKGLDYTTTTVAKGLDYTTNTAAKGMNQATTAVNNLLGTQDVELARQQRIEQLAQAGMSESELMELKQHLHHQGVTATKSQAKIQAKPLLWTQSNAFSFTVGTFVVINAVSLGVEADYGDTYRLFFNVCEHIFTFIFCTELILHFCVEGPRVYFKDALNWLDAFIVTMSVIDVWVIRPIGIKADLRMMSVLRMMRLIRLARLVRLLRIFKELTLLVTGFIDSVKTLFWSFIFLLCIVYAFALFAQQTIGSAMDCPEAGNEDLCEPSFGSQAKLFHSVDRTMLTLFICLTEGCGASVIEPIVLKRPILIAFFLLFTFVTTLGLLNLIVCLLCENALCAAAAQEKELEKQKDDETERQILDLKMAFLEMDEDKSGEITREEFYNSLATNDNLVNALVGLGLGDEANLFDTLDSEQVGVIKFQQFLTGVGLIMRGNESAKAKDVVPALLLCQAMDQRLKRLEHMVSKLYENGCRSGGPSSSGSPSGSHVPSAGNHQPGNKHSPLTREIAPVGDAPGNKHAPSHQTTTGFSSMNHEDGDTAFLMPLSKSPSMGVHTSPSNQSAMLDRPQRNVGPGTNGVGQPSNREHYAEPARPLCCAASNVQPSETILLEAPQTDTNMGLMPMQSVPPVLIQLLGSIEFSMADMKESIRSIELRLSDVEGDGTGIRETKGVMWQ